jgi:hypothetical protein
MNTAAQLLAAMPHGPMALPASVVAGLLWQGAGWSGLAHGAFPVRRRLAMVAVILSMVPITEKGITHIPINSTIQGCPNENN